jgi:GTP-binding protein LepA
VDDLLEAIVARVPPPSGDPAAPARALVFDSLYDIYRGVIAYVRMVDGTLDGREKLKMLASGASAEIDEVGVFAPEAVPTGRLVAGDVGYVITGMKDVRQATVGDTATSLARPATEPLPGYREPRPMVYSGLYPVEGADFPDLRDALDRLRLNDAALVYEPESSAALGFGFRCGFLGLLHMEIVRERLEREFDLELITTAPNVAYQVHLVGGRELTVSNPSELPPSGQIERIEEPYVAAMILCPKDYVGPVMDLCQTRRGNLAGMDYLSEERVELRYSLPLAEIIFDFFDQLKSRTRGYASLDYEPAGYQASKLVRVDVLLQGEPVDAFSAIVHSDKAYAYGRSMATKLRKLIPRQMFEVPIQAAIGAKVIARETIAAKRKDVLAKCYGGDITRKRKLLERQKEGKKRMKQIGRVEVPQEAFVAALRTDEDEPK